MSKFPRTEVAGISLPRMLIGSNWISGFSHTSTSADKMILERYDNPEAVASLVEAYLEYDINALMACFTGNRVLLDGIRLAEERSGKKVIRIDTPIVDMSDTREGRASAQASIKTCKRNGADFCLIHHSCAEKLVSKLYGTLDRLPEYLDLIRQNDMIPGLSAHMPELILYADQNEYDVQTYIQPYNCIGFMMQVEVEYIHSVIQKAKKPVMTIKTMAAGRITPFVGLTFAYATIRPCDMVTLGAFTPEEVHEDVEIALAALERRPPSLAGRASPNKTAALGGK
jgi:hypothetical protein